jgi:orotidine-5'-phosphate decarboxylase
MVKNIADNLIDRINSKQCPCVVGVDTIIGKVPEYIKNECLSKYGNTLQAVAEALWIFNKGLIDAIYDIAPAVKPQSACYEMYGLPGLLTLSKTITYAQSKGLLVIEDVKRNDIMRSASGYAIGHLGKAPLIKKGTTAPAFNADMITVNGLFGIDGIQPFLDESKNHNKGIFVLAKTSNPSSGQLQDLITEGGKPVYEVLGELINEWANEEGSIGESGYSFVGAVVGATYPEHAKKLRKIMPNSIILVPGYGKQGGAGKDTIPNFNKDGQGAIVNNSSALDFAYTYEKYKCSSENYAQASRNALIDMTADISDALKEAGICRW